MHACVTYACIWTWTWAWAWAFAHATCKSPRCGHVELAWTEKLETLVFNPRIPFNLSASPIQGQAEVLQAQAPN